MDNLKDSKELHTSSPILKVGGLRTQPFGPNSVVEKLYKRAERIAAAIHLVTNRVYQGEPVRSTLRAGSLMLLELIVSAQAEMRSPNSQKRNEIISLILRLISNVRILVVAGHISAENAEVLIDALDDAAAHIQQGERTSLAESIVLSKGQFVDEAEATASQGQAGRVIKDNAAVRRTATVPRAVRVNGRKEKIVDILRAEGQLGIKDISSRLPEYSEKMIQRELKALAASGRVSKAGSKRWSTYKLAS